MNLFDDHDWTDDAGCRGKPTEWWFGEEGTSYDGNHPGSLPAGMRRALFTCWNKCPVRTECLEHAMRKPERYGIWGGALPQDRRGNPNAASARARARVERLSIVREERSA